MILVAIAVVACVLAVIPALVFYRNLKAYAPPPPYREDSPIPAVSVLIPARNEAQAIRAAVESVLASTGATVEIIVLDDHSQDTTAAIVSAIAAGDPRVRVAAAPPVPPGWCGKQHACAVLAQMASHALLVFIDADVRLTPQGLARTVSFLDHSGAALASGFPRQETGTFLEHVVLPLIHFLLLGFLPLKRMRASRHPAYGAGCGQLFVAHRAAYEQTGGHGAIRDSLHDGVKLPRSFRKAGLATDLFDATDIAVCRMYRSAREVWHGLAKNATEGLATPSMILPATILLLGGQVLPPVLLLGGLLGELPPLVLGGAALGTMAVYYPRLVMVRRFRHTLLGAILHPLGILILLAIQWYAFGRRTLGFPATWKGRTYARHPSRVSA